MTELTRETLFNHSMQPENERLALLKQHFPNCFDKHGAFLPDKMAEILHSDGIQTKKEGYSLNWLGKSYAKLLKDTPPETLLAEDTEHNRQPENANSENLLIKGDNLEVLKHLKHAYKNQVKMIYIDPPYNTGSDGFVYQDDRKFTPEQLAELGGMDLDEAERILAFTAKKSNSHSAWLTFMYPRLYVARELLREDGVIFISIDDNEQAQLKLLCDDVFGEENFVTNFIWKSKLGKIGTTRTISTTHEYILCYSKNLLSLEFQMITTNQEGRRENLRQWGQADRREDRPSMYYPIEINGVSVLPIKDDGSDGRWRVGQETAKELLETGQLELISRNGNYQIYRNFPEHQSITSYESIISEEVGTTANGARTLNSLELNRVFDYSKSVDLIKFFIYLSKQENSLILDFFAGSGTTAHAVMQLNAEDGGHRRYICVQLPEETDKNSEAFKAGYKTIFDIAKARIEKAAAKIHAEHPDYSGDLGFKLFETVPLLAFQAALKTDFDPIQANLPYITDTTLSDEQLHTLLTTWRVYDGSRLPEKVQAIDLAGYTAYYCRNHLYLLASGFYSECVKALIEKLDNDKDFVPERIVLLSANIESAMQKELKQAVETYANKKGLNNLSVLARM